MRFEDVVELHSPRLYRLAYLYLRDAQSAEDAVQEAFLRYFREQASVGNPGGWLNRVTRNVCLNLLRKQKKEQQVDPMELPEEESEPWPDQVAEALCMSEMLVRLPLAYREVLIWRYYLGVSDHELAMQLDISPSTLRTRLSRARKAAARLLKEEEA